MIRICTHTHEKKSLICNLITRARKATSLTSGVFFPVVKSADCVIDDKRDVTLQDNYLIKEAAWSSG